MALKKKNVFQEFMQDDYLPSGEQQIVKYLTGKGNNLHEVETTSGSIYLVSMPKKYRHTVWLKRGDCIVVDPISEGKKVLGEIICVIPSKAVVDLIQSGEWMPKDGEGCGDGEKERLVAFFSGRGSSKNGEDNGDRMMMPPSDSEEEEGSEESDGENDDDEESDGVKVQVGEQRGNLPTPDPNLSPTPNDEDGFKSRVQFLTSGVVTVTNVVNDISSLGLENGLQSLDFHSEDSSLDSQQHPETANGSQSQQDSSTSTVHRKANTIRIQVNYPPGSGQDYNVLSNNSNGSSHSP